MYAIFKFKFNIYPAKLLINYNTIDVSNVRQRCLLEQAKKEKVN